MRLWHQRMIRNLDNSRLLSQHRECCALRGNGWGKPHATVNYVFEYSPIKLVMYHYLVYMEMSRRGYQFDKRWLEPSYRGGSCSPDNSLTMDFIKNEIALLKMSGSSIIYPEHDDKYFEECINNLKEKGIPYEQFID